MTHFRTQFCASLALMGLMLSTAAQAHEFILKPDTATPAAGQKTRLQAQAAHVFMVSEENSTLSASVAVRPGRW